jgi:hypothetical protein
VRLRVLKPSLNFKEQIALLGQGQRLARLDLRSKFA